MCFGVNDAMIVCLDVCLCVCITASVEHVFNEVKT